MKRFAHWWQTLRKDGLLARWNSASRAYFQRWLLIGALIGVVAGPLAAHHLVPLPLSVWGRSSEALARYRWP
jgi:hypothetical protein